MIFETVWSKKIKLRSYSTTSFSFKDIYWMENFASKPVGFKAISMSVLKKYHDFWNVWSYRLIFSGLPYLYDTYHWWKLQKNWWDKGDMIRKFCMIWHGITPLKTWILQIQTTTEKIKLIGYLILGEIKFCNLKNEHFEKKSPKS